jgi:hypothetical protein
MTDLFALDGLLTGEEREVRDRVRAFSDAEVIPVMAGCWERGEFPLHLVPKLAKFGICGDTVEGFGCAGLSAVGVGLAAMNGILYERPMARHVARHWADMEAVYTYEGTDSINSLIVGRKITGHRAFS